MKKIVSVIGGLNLDIVGKSYGKVLPDNSNPGQINTNIGGVACNIARILFKLGKNSYSTIFYSSVGDDIFADVVIKLLPFQFRRASHIFRHPDYSTGVYLSILDEHGNMITSVSSTEAVENINVNEWEDGWKNEIADSTFIVLDTNLSIQVINDICGIAEERKIPVLIDPVSVQKAEKLLALSHPVTYITPNEEEYSVVKRVTEKMTAGLPGGLIEKILITKGVNGAELINLNPLTGNHNISRFKTIKGEIINPNGAGDSFAAGFVHALLSGYTETNAVLYGIALSLITLESRESVPQHLTDEIIKEKYKLVEKINQNNRS